MYPKTVLVTGASRGIGRAVALEFAKRQCQVVINCVKSVDKLMRLQKEIETLSQKDCLAIAGDVGDAPFVKSMFEQIQNAMGGVDILINNAGISYVGLLEDMETAEWDNILKTNLSSAFYCSKYAIGHMVRQKSGAIINISSVWGNVGASCEAAYSASKGGLNSLTRALAKELAPSGISVNAIACGAIDTEMNQFLSDGEREKLTEEIPAGRFGTPEEVARLCCELAFESSYLTGQIIRLDGGWI